MDEAVVSQLVDMGFPHNACVKGVYFSNNTGIEAAMNWVMEHMDDPGEFTCCHILLTSSPILSCFSSMVPSIHI